ncbi:PC-esterase domain-containing protein 1A-like isoform X1 [Bufo gargarizans]|uniref:PC-esterase domain-containing protein 1A-like isoform X1 n=1 Tax=Bufo gargarizans TaxID=30331 RepID=UPI001CF2B690|nr:PC-esterase domain-containing protein 1A-like isoform X1 [Bufo gargarizans]
MSLCLLQVQSWSGSAQQMCASYCTTIQRSVYKDLVKMLQDDAFLSEAQLRKRGEETFQNDALVEGGVRNGMHNGTTFREVRQYRSGHHLVRFYFLTRVYSTYLESVLSDFRRGPQPDVLMANSCVWDVNRYNDKHLEAYKTNLDTMFQRLKEVLSPKCLIIWNMTMPVGFKYNEVPECMVHNLRMDIVEGNFFSATLADLHKLDVLDMHYHFRCNLRLRCKDAVHWNQVAHRKYTQILLTHIAQAWGVEVPKGKMPEGYNIHTAPHDSVALRKAPHPKLPPKIKKRCSPGKIPLLPTPSGAVMGSQYTGLRLLCAGVTIWGQQLIVPLPVSAGTTYIPGYTSFDGNGINAIPGLLCPEFYTDEKLINSDAASPFVTDSPLLTANITPGYFTPPSGPRLSSHPFAGGNFLVPSLPPHPSFIPFPPYAPYPQQDWNVKITSRRVLKQRTGWTHPYPRPPAYAPRIY